MSRSTKWKLAIIAGFSECLVYAEAKFCAFEIHGEPKYYKCPRTEYCCNFGCCVTPGFQIYHLWYYWLLVIIMFLMCSGGGWWYRYWLQGRYRASASAIPTRSSSSRAQNSLRGPTCQAQQARITYNTARNTVLLHRMWKGPARSAASATYGGAAAASSAAHHYQNTSVVLNDANCPYYQLYGPPPSYETVIAQSRGKMSSPSSPELPPRHHHQGQQPRPIAEPGFVGQCFYSIVPGLEAPRYQPSAGPARFVDGFDAAEYVGLVQRYGGGGGGPTASPRRQPPPAESGARSSLAYSSKSSENSDGESSLANRSQADSPDEGGFARPDWLGSACALERSARRYASAGKLASRVGVHGFPRRDHLPFGSGSSSQSELTAESVATTSSSLGPEGCPAPASLLPHRPMSRAELRRVQGGSLRIPRRRELQHAGGIGQHRQEAVLPRADREPIVDDTRPDPSSNVISTANATAATPKIARDAAACGETGHRRPQPSHHRSQRPSATLTVAERRSTNDNSNLESKRKLDRSRSLD